MAFDFGRANDQQKKAIVTTTGPVLITAGPGTGKTFTLVQRAIYLIQECGVLPEEIFIATFTEKAAKELVTRITNELAAKDISVNVNEMYVGTFHSLCLRIIKEHLEYSRLKKNYRMLDSFDAAYECLGYIWYYGRTGERDYKKAFEYFSKLMDKGNPVATYKVADMYKNGYYVEKDEKKYEDIVKKLYKDVQECKNVFDPIPEVYTRLAKIKTKEGDVDEAIGLYLRAKDWLAQRIRYNAFFGNLNIMKWLIDDLYKLIEFDEETFDFYDMYYLLKSPHKIRFFYNKQELQLESVLEGNECYHSRDDFFKDAMADGVKLTSVYDELYGFEVVANG